MTLTNKHPEGNAHLRDATIDATRRPPASMPVYGPQNPEQCGLFGASRSPTDTLTQVACARIDLPSFIPTVRSAPEFHRIVRIAVRHCARGLYHRSGIARQPCRTHPAPKVFVFCCDDLAMDGCCLHCTN